MKRNTNLLHRARRKITGSLALFCLFAPTLQAATIDDDFSTPDPEWVSFDPFAPLGVTSTYEIEDGKYVLTTRPSPMLSLGPVTANAVREVNWSNFTARVEVSQWTSGGDSNVVVGVSGRVAINPDGTTKGYFAGLSPNIAESIASPIDRTPILGLYVVNNGIPSLLGVAGIPELDPAESYTLELSANGPVLQARLFRAGESTAWRTVRGTDNTYSSGSLSLFVVHREPISRGSGNHGVSVAFDNYHAEDSAVAGLPSTLFTPVPSVTYSIQDDFNSANDAGWQRLNPIGNGTYEFADGRYVLSAPPSPVPNISPAVVGSVRPVDWSDFQMSVEFTGWLSGTNASQYIMANGRHRNNPDGTADFYGARIVHGPNPHTGTAQSALVAIERWERSVITHSIGVAQLGPLLDPAKTYRLVFAGRGAYLRVWVYETGAAETLLGYVEGTDEQLTSGGLAILLIDRFGINGVGQRAISAQFDNFKAWGADSMSEDFSGELPATFLQFHPFAAFGVHGSVVSSGGTVTLSHPPSPAPQIAPALLSLYRDANWTDAEVSVEFTGWSTGPKTNVTITLGLRVNPGASGAGNGYVFAIIPSASPELQGSGYDPTAGLSFERVSNGASLYGSLAAREMPPLDPAKWYRAVFRITTDANNQIAGLRGEVYEVGASEPHAALSMRIPQPAFHSGAVTVSAVDRAALARVANNGFTVTFDNFRAHGVSVPLVANPSVEIDSAIILNWPGATAGWLLEAAAQANGPWSATSLVPQVIAGENQVAIRSSEAQQFYRLRKP